MGTLVERHTVWVGPRASLSVYGIFHVFVFVVTLFLTCQVQRVYVFAYLGGTGDSKSRQIFWITSCLCRNLANKSTYFRRRLNWSFQESLVLNSWTWLERLYFHINSNTLNGIFLCHSTQETSDSCVHWIIIPRTYFNNKQQAEHIKGFLNIRLFESSDALFLLQWVTMACN